VSFPLTAEQALSSAVSYAGWQGFVQLYNTSFDQARPQCPALWLDWTVAWHVGIQTVAVWSQWVSSVTSC